MRIFSKSSPPPYEVILEPCNPPIGLNATFCSPNIETLYMKEKITSFKDADIAVLNEAREEVLKCHCHGRSDKKGEFVH